MRRLQRCGSSMLQRKKSDDYLAGVFDGEGSISAYRQKTGAWVIRCQMSICNLEVCTLFLERFGGKVHKRKKLTTGGLQQYDWYINASNAIEFMQWAKDNCLIKNMQAEIALPIAISMLKYRKSRAGKKAKDMYISDEDKKLRTDALERMRSLNGARSRFGNYTATRDAR